jgi:hypothetical protein
MMAIIPWLSGGAKSIPARFPVNLDGWPSPGALAPRRAVNAAIGKEDLPVISACPRLRTSENGGDLVRTIDTAVKTGTDNDGTAVTFFGYDEHAPFRS